LTWGNRVEGRSLSVRPGPVKAGRRRLGTGTWRERIRAESGQLRATTDVRLKDNVIKIRYDPDDPAGRVQPTQGH
jgi:hypothetical protein